MVKCFPSDVRGPRRFALTAAGAVAERGDEADSTEGARPAAKRTRRVKKYIPAPRSGAHGIIVGLYTKVLEYDSTDVSLGKAELIARSQPFCDSDYSVPGGGSLASMPRSLSQARTYSGAMHQGQSKRSFMTAWSAMKTLIDKGYVYRSGNPPVYTLSDDGAEIARLLAEAEGIATSEATASQGAASTAGGGSITAPDSSQQPPSLSTTTSGTSGASVPLAQSSGDVCRQSETLSQRGKLYLPPRSAREAVNTRLDRDAIDEAIVVDLLTSSDDDPSGACAQQQGRSSPQHEPARISISLLDSSPSSGPTTISTSPVVVEHARIPEAQGYVSQAGWATQRLHTVLPRGSFDIVMIVDHREVRSRPRRGPVGSQAGDARVSHSFSEAMVQRGVSCEQRALELGDILWIARPKAGLSERDAEAWRMVQEVVLDVVIERKRLDDLTMSIIDGRWSEQKVRRVPGAC